MKIYWSTVIPLELAGLSESDRRRIWVDCHRGILFRGWTWLGMLICGCCGGLGSILGIISHSGLSGAMIGSGIGGGLGGLILSRFATRAALQVVTERYGKGNPPIFHNDNDHRQNRGEQNAGDNGS